MHMAVIHLSLTHFIWDYRDMKNDKIERTISFVGKNIAL